MQMAEDSDNWRIQSRKNTRSNPYGNNKVPSAEQPSVINNNGDKYKPPNRNNNNKKAGDKTVDYTRYNNYSKSSNNNKFDNYKSNNKFDNNKSNNNNYKSNITTKPENEEYPVNDWASRVKTPPKKPATPPIIIPEKEEKKLSFISSNEWVRKPIGNLLPTEVIFNTIKKSKYQNELPFALEEEDPEILKDKLESAYWDRKYEESLREKYDSDNELIEEGDDLHYSDEERSY
jgi:hypothetical protein